MNILPLSKTRLLYNSSPILSPALERTEKNFDIEEMMTFDQGRLDHL